MSAPDKPKMRRHVFVWSPDSDWKGIPYCGEDGCGQPRNSPVHNVPATSSEQRAAEARRIGEGE